MKAFRLLAPSIPLALAVLIGCAPARQDMLVANIGDDGITLGEYERLYAKTTSSKDSAKATSAEDQQKFLDLLVNFRLKLLDAYDEGLDRHPEVRSEMALYQGSLATSYLVDREVTQPGIRHLYDQRTMEYRASHILLDAPASSDPKDSAEAYGKAYDLIRRIAAGEDFAALAKEYSKDPGTKDKGGDLYYFTAGQMVRPFEEAAMALNVGQVTPAPVRTQFGLHIIKLMDKKPSSGELRCSHIMTRFSSQDPTPEDTAAAYEGITAILDSLNQGGDFAELARRHSADPGSAPNGGDLGWFSRRRWPVEFDEEAFRLHPGQTSGIVRSRYGYHLIRCTDARPAKSFEESYDDIKKLYEQSRFDEDRASYVKKLKAETGFRLDENVLNQVISGIDTMKQMRDAHWADSLSAGVRTSVLMYFTGGAVSVDSTVKLLRLRSDLNSTSLRPASFRNAIDKIAEQAVFTVKSASLMKTDPDFAALMKEYMDGILLYQIEQQKVWDRIAVTDSALKAFFDTHHDRFTFPDRIRYQELRVSNAPTAQAYYDEATGGKSFEEIAAEDSARMARPGNHKLMFGNGSTRFSKETGGSITEIAQDLKSDPMLRLNLVAHPDTAAGKKRNTDVANKRLDRIKSVLTGKHGIEASRIQTIARPIVGPALAGDPESSPKILNNQIDADVVGRRDNVIGKVETVLAPLDEDERSKQAGLIEEGEISKPFRYKNGFSIIRALGTEPAREKTYEEAGTEISSAFQEYESKRLEAEWLDGLRAEYPVVKHPEVLQMAFEPASR